MCCVGSLAFPAHLRREFFYPVFSEVFSKTRERFLKNAGKIAKNAVFSFKINDLDIRHNGSYHRVISEYEYD